MGYEKMSSNKPIILLPGKYTEIDIENLRKNSKIWKEVNIYANQLEELLEIKFPNSEERAHQKEDFLKKHKKNGGSWVYYPWSGILLHTVGPEELYELRTNRNQNLVTSKEQQKLSSATIGVAGMSVGAGIAIGSVYSGIGKIVKLADFDQLETANLNRVRESLTNVGQKKLELAAQRIQELDPFIEVHMFSDGISSVNITDYFTDPELDVVVDEIDDFKMKVMLRVKAKEHKVPLLMFTSLGDNILVDIERYDINPKQEIFNGAIGDIAGEILMNKNISPDDIKRYAVQVVGANYIPTRALESLPHIGTTLVGRPQLYGTVAVDGGLAPYIIRQILLDSNLKSGRYFIKFSELFNLDTKEFSETPERSEILKKLMGKNEK